MEERRREVAIEKQWEGDALDKGCGGVGGDENGVEDGGKINRIKGGGEGGDDDCAGLGQLARLLGEGAAGVSRRESGGGEGEGGEDVPALHAFDLEVDPPDAGDAED